MGVRIWWLNIILGLSAAWGAYHAHQIWQKAVVLPLHSKSQKSSTALPAVAQYISKPNPSENYYESIAKASLFDASRKEPIPQEPEIQKPKKKKASPKKQKIYLYGIVQMGDQKSALLVSTSRRPNQPKENRWVAEGDSFSDYQVAEIGLDHLILTRADERLELDLYDPLKPRVSKSTPAPRAKGPRVIDGANKPKVRPTKARPTKAKPPIKKRIRKRTTPKPTGRNGRSSPPLVGQIERRQRY